MPLSPGTRLGHYDVTALIGEGGMGQVWRATDTQLGREVALKILPDAFAADPERLARFTREAQILASLNHPNIAAIYGIEEAEGTRALVLELVEGPTLADRISKGPIPLDEALSIAKQIAEAVEAAHEAGVIHRDLKPANIKVRDDGTVKVLDFGLAKAMDSLSPGEEGRGEGDGRSQSPTLTAAATQMGVIIGTAAYMSPEQARGARVDHRSDIWAFGVILLEMLTGRPSFAGNTVSDTLAFVLTKDPDWSALPANTPASIRRLLRRCLVKDQKRRLGYIGDARLEIDEPPDDSGLSAPEARQSRPWAAIIVAGALSAVVAGAAALTLRPTAPTPEPVRFTIRTQSGEPLGQAAPLAISPDGRQVVYGAGASGTRLFLHDLEGFEARVLEDSENARTPFFSADGAQVGFTTVAGSLQALPVTAGVATSLGGVDVVEYGASWDVDGTLVLSSSWGRPLRILRPGGSEGVDLTRVDSEAGEGSHLWPQILPGGQYALFTIWTGAPWDEARIAAVDLETGDHHVVWSGGAFGRHVASGHLLFWRANALWAASFDATTVTVTGEPVRVIDGVRLNNGSGAAHFAVSETGTLVYVTGRQDSFAESYITDRSGQELLRLDRDTAVGSPAFSPDGRRIALTVFNQGTYDVGVFDLERAFLTRIVSGRDNLRASWSPDGQRVTYLSNADGDYNYYSIPSDGSGSPDPLFPESNLECCFEAEWSPDGEHLVYTSAATGLDVWIQSQGQAPAPLIDGPGNEAFAVFSPNGRFLAYQSDQSDRNEIFVVPFPAVESRRAQVSEAGGRRPRWSQDGNEILYLTDEGVMRAPVSYPADESDFLVAGRSALLFELSGIAEFDVTADGERLAVQRFPLETAAREIRVVLSFFEELERLVPVP